VRFLSYEAPHNPGCAGEWSSGASAIGQGGEGVGQRSWDVKTLCIRHGQATIRFLRDDRKSLRGPFKRERSRGSLDALDLVRRSELL
jgi:hypothetical protein